MAIRLRLINKHLIAICAARSMPKEGDVYLDDGQHGALGQKFARDYAESYGYEFGINEEEARLVEQEESNNPNREWWDKTYGAESTRGVV